MDAKLQALGAEKDQLLRRLAEIQVEEQRLAGVFDSVPHYSVLEGAAHQLGQQLSRLTQERAVREVAASSATTAGCPGCGQAGSIAHGKRTVKSLDGPVELVEPVAYCSACRRDFFPSA